LPALRKTLGFGYAQKLAHLLVEESVTGAIGLDPGAIYDELWNGALACSPDDFFGSTRDALDIDLFVGDLMLIEEALGDPTIGTPGGGIDEQVHR
jgi:hypothetical protein